MNTRDQESGEDKLDSKDKSWNNARYSMSYLRVSEDRAYMAKLR